MIEVSGDYQEEPIDAPLTEAELTELEALESEATARPWWSENSELYWTLHGTAGWMHGQPVNWQILKAAKQSKVFQPYWPNRKADADLVPRMRNALPRLIKELKELRELVHRCVCADGAPGDYEGPRDECPVHGAIQALREVREENRALKERLSVLEEWADARPTIPPTHFESAQDVTVEDGFGGSWLRCKPGCDLHVVRPGKVQCSCEDHDG